MAILTAMKWEGKSGSEYSFHVYDGYPVKFASVAAVYLITRRHQKNVSWHHTLIYVGQTSDLSERFYNHHKHQCFVEKSANSMSVRVEISEATRLNIEEDIKTKWNPPCND